MKPAAAQLRRGGILLPAILAGLLAALAESLLFADVVGLTYDEPVYAAVGERHLAWCGRVLRCEASAFSTGALEEGFGNSGPIPSLADWHPPLGKLVLAGSRRLPWPGGPFAHYRLGSALLFGLTGSLLYLWLAAAAGRPAGIAAALIWWTLPRAIGHGCLATIDMPVACFSTLALALAWRLGRAPSARRGVGLGLAVAAACLAKFNGVLVVPAALGMLARRREARRPLVLAAVTAALAGWLCWPWLWYDGLTHLRQVLAFHGRHGLIAVAYAGRIWNAEPAPWHYPFVMLAVTTPVLVLLAAAFGAGARESRPIACWLAVGLLCHLLPYAQPSAAKYNGVRLFLPALPLLAGLAGLGVAAAAARLARIRSIAPLLLAAVCLPSLVGVLRVYPYPLAYYNVLVGGAAGADLRGYEAIYWGEPLREACAWLSRNAPAGSGVYLHPPGFQSSLEMYRPLGLLREDLRLTGPAEADFIVYQNRRSEWDEAGFALAASKRPAQVILADAAPVAFIWPGR